MSKAARQRGKAAEPVTMRPVATPQVPVRNPATERGARAAVRFPSAIRNRGGWVAAAGRVLIFVALCTMPTGASAQAGPRTLELVTPSRTVAGIPTPIRVAVRTPDGRVDWSVWNATVELEIVDGPGTLEVDLTYSRCQPNPSRSAVWLHNGLGSVSVRLAGASVYTIRATWAGLSATATVTHVDPNTAVTRSGVFNGATVDWGPDALIHVVDRAGEPEDLFIPAGTRLRIFPGTIVLLDPAARIRIEGTVEVLGSREAPILLTAWDPDNEWGQIVHVGEPSRYQWCFLSFGGDAPSRGHTSEGPVILAEDTAIDFFQCSIIDNRGKVLFSRNSSLTFDNCHFARCEMGPEIAGTSLVAANCHFVAFRPEGGDSGDNDGIYLNGRGAIRIADCVFACCGDEGIDTLGSDPTIERCIIRDMRDKGMSIFGGTTTVRNSLLVDNADGTITAKGDNAEVVIDHCTLVGGRYSIWARKKSNTNAADRIVYAISNSILWGARERTVQVDAVLNNTLTIVNYCDLDGQTFPRTGAPPAGQQEQGVGNVTDIPPRFVDPVAGNYALASSSLLIDAGDPGFVPADGETDLTGQPRLADGGTALRVDLGAHEYQWSRDLAGDLDGDGDIDLADYLILTACYRGAGVPHAPGCGPADLDFDGDVDLSDLVHMQSLFTGSR